MNQQVDPFAPTYAQARAKFLAAARGLPLQSHPEPLRGVELEPLAMDVARLGADDADRLLILSSGCHGIEGYCGSGAQVALLEDEAFRTRARDAGVALLFIHALNPWGFSFGRRVTHEGVDLNRNFVDFRRPTPRNAGYDQLAGLLLPELWPPTGGNELQLMSYAAAHGMPALQQAVSGGQYDHPDGVFYGGKAPTWSHNTLRMVLRQHATKCRQLGWIDLHSGLGPPGVGEHIHSGSDAASLARARRWWGPSVRSLAEGDSVSPELVGQMGCAAEQECPQAELTGIAIEFGTLPLLEVFDALRAEQWLESHPETSTEQATAIRHQCRDAFYLDTPAWKQRVVEQGLQAARAAVAGLRSA